MTATQVRPIRLLALDGSSEILVGATPVVIGRHRLCDVRLSSSRVSRQHCCLALIDGEIVARDLGSTNGVWINGLRINWGRLKPGDVLSIAHLSFQVEEPSDMARTMLGPRR